MKRLPARANPRLRLVWLGVMLTVACGDGSGSAVARGPAGGLTGLATDFWDWYLTWHPLEATYLGQSRFDDRLADPTPEGRDARWASAQALIDRLADIDMEGLDEADRFTYLALEHELGGELAGRVCEPGDWVVDHREGVQVAFLNIVSAQPLATARDGDHMITRWHAMARYLDDYVSNLRSGAERGRVAARASISRTIVQLDALLERPVNEWPVFAPAGARLDGWAEDDRHRFRAEIRDAAENGIRPAYERLRDFLRDELFESGRPDTAPGLASLPGGPECYRALIRDFTTLDLSPEEIHATGLSELAGIHLEMLDLGRTALGAADLSEIQHRLRDDPAHQFRWPGEIVQAAEEATARASSVMGDWFGITPKARLSILPIPVYEAPQSIVAYYRQPAPDGSRPGIYFVNTYRPEVRPRYQAEVLTFHESIPGHHLQTAIAQELPNLPEFQKHLGPTVFTEGWALYAERLADEMGIYTGDLDRLGMLSYDAWRASRLVVDTGIHALGWSREQAIEYLRVNTLLAQANIENEVDRYITSPGQALTYKLGQLEISRLRREAEARLGADFEIADFHDRLLGDGALGMRALRESIESWIEARAAGG